jgi:hypothetical protein
MPGRLEQPQAFDTRGAMLLAPDKLEVKKTVLIVFLQIPAYDRTKSKGRASRSSPTRYFSRD